MIKIATPLFIICLALLIVIPGYSKTKRYVYGKERSYWRGVQVPVGTQFILGRDGSYDLVLRENSYQPQGGNFRRNDNASISNSSTDLLVSFDGITNRGWKRPIGNYIVRKRHFIFDNRIKMFGLSSGKFIHPRNNLTLQPTEGSIFNQITNGGDFTIEFWLRPALLTSNEVVLKKYGSVIENGIVTKNSGIVCRIENRRLKWEFHNLFHKVNISDDGETESRAMVQLISSKRLRPNHWGHHALTFDSQSGRMTYYFNGKAQRIIFVTESQQPDDTVLSLKFYPQERSNLVIGDHYYGYIDELMISKTCKAPANDIIVQLNRSELSNNDSDDNAAPPRQPFHLTKYPNSEGIAFSTTEDLMKTGSYLKRVRINSEQRYGSKIIIQYRMSNQYFDSATPESENLRWIDIDPQDSSQFYRQKVVGRFFQWRAIFKGSQNGKYTPILKDIEFVFEIDESPSSPTDLIAYSSRGKVYLKWKGCVEGDVEKYRIYYGIRSGVYYRNAKIIKRLRQTGPIEVPVNQLSNKIRPVYVLEDLEPNEVYYFVVSAVDRNGHESSFSNEISIKVRRGR